MSNIEIVANVFTVLCIFLAGRNSVHTWWTGIIACVSFIWVFFGAKLYADMVLQLFFIASSAYGWWVWSERKDQSVVPITKSDSMYLMIIVLLAAVGVIGFSSMLALFTDAAYPFIDSGILCLSVAGQILMANRKVENWPFWIVVNTLSVPLFYSRELYLTTGLYAIFWFHAWYAWYIWNREMKVKNACLI